jgi:imidazole glycerol-phosphate synthase subunit HisH
VGSVGILDIEMGNLRSLCNAIDSLGVGSLVVREPSALAEASRVLIPGVGSYRAAMGNLTRLGFVEPLRRFAASGKPVLGICLGMQILSTRGEEGGAVQGLALIPGDVVLMEPESLRLPHVGWNSVTFRAPHPVLHALRDGRDFYFVHSYELRCAPEHSYAETVYGRPFASIVGVGNVLGVQFHPEKSQRNGLQLLENFCRWDGAC